MHATYSVTKNERRKFCDGQQILEANMAGRVRIVW